MKSPDCVTLTVTSRLALGTGLAVIVKTALPPSVMAAPPAMLTTGSAGGGVASQLSRCMAVRVRAMRSQRVFWRRS